MGYAESQRAQELMRDFGKKKETAQK